MVRLSYIPYGVKVVENPMMTKDVLVPVKKSWWQRVLEWNPCNTEFYVHPLTSKTVPSTEVFFIGANTVVVHPATARALAQACQA